MSYDGPWRPPPDRQPGEHPPFEGQPGDVSPFERQPGERRPFERQPGDGSSYGRQPGRSPDDPWDHEPGPYDSRQREPGPYERQPQHRWPGDTWPGDRPSYVRPSDDGARHGRQPGHRRGSDAWPGEPPPSDDERFEPDTRQAASDPGRSRAWLAVAGLAVVGAVAAASLVTQADGGESGSGSSAEGWEVADLGNSQRLASDGDRTCSVSADSLLFCLDPTTGEQVFSHQFYVGMVTSPVMAEGRVIVGAHGAGSPGTLHAFSPAGDEQWTLALDVTSDRRMAVVDGVMAVVSGETTDGELVGIDVETGAELWRLFTAPEGDTSAPHVVSGNVFGDGTRFYVVIAAGDPAAPTGIAGQVVALDPRSGEEAWRSEALPAVGWSRGASSVAAFDDGSALAFALDGVVGGSEDEPTDGPAVDDPRVVVLDSATGEVRWDVPMAEGDLPGVAHVDGVTVVTDGVDLGGYAEDGEQVWEAAVPGRDDASTQPEPVALDREGDRLFAVGRDVHQIDPASGQSGLVLDSGTTTDVSVAGDHLVIAGVFAVTAVPVSGLPLDAEPETVVTG